MQPREQPTKLLRTGRPPKQKKKNKEWRAAPPNSVRYWKVSPANCRRFTKRIRYRLEPRGLDSTGRILTVSSISFRKKYESLKTSFPDQQATNGASGSRMKSATFSS